METRGLVAGSGIGNLTEWSVRNGKSKRTGLKSRHYNKHGASVWRRKVQRFGASAKGSSARGIDSLFGHLRCEPLGVGGTVMTNSGVPRTPRGYRLSRLLSYVLGRRVCTFVCDH